MNHTDAQNKAIHAGAKTKALKGKSTLLSDKEAVKRFHAHQAKIKTMSPTNPDHPDYAK